MNLQTASYTAVTLPKFQISKKEQQNNFGKNRTLNIDSLLEYRKGLNISKRGQLLMIIRIDFGRSLKTHG
ncbi:hypothetical protein HZS_4691 [Henneguya salminicola]|nr:hypothetical protein HZS_4691 [Henneguya salminicola]